MELQISILVFCTKMKNIKVYITDDYVPTIGKIVDAEDGELLIL